MIERLLKRLAENLEKAGIPYMIIGGQAVLFYGFPRLTQDVDVTLGVDIDAYTKVGSVCRQARLKPMVERPENFVRKTHVLPTKDPRSGFRVDFIFSNTPYERQAIARASRVRLGPVRIRIASLEDLLIHKLVAGRAVDIEDVRILLAKHRKKVDLRYLRHWLKQFGSLGILPKNPLLIFDRIRRSLPSR